jgi:predicted nucleotidyltransferase
MSMNNPDVEQIKQITTEILQKEGVVFAGLFGSYSRGEEGKESDIDILVRFDEPKSLLRLVNIQNRLSDALNKNVDLVTEKFLSPYFRQSVLDNLLVIYERR